VLIGHSQGSGVLTELIKAEIDGKPIRIDGGPAIVDFGSLLDDMDKALGKVLGDDASFAEFAQAVLGSSPSEDARKQLRQDVRLFSTEKKIRVQKK